MKNKNYSSNSGITLVALVITIIILLILAGITIAQLTGSGLFQRARQAQDEYEISDAKEALNTELMSIMVNEQGKKDLNNLNGMTINGYTTEVSEIGKIVTMTKNNKSYYFLVDSDYNIQSLDKISSVGTGNNSSGSTSGSIQSTIINDFEIEISHRSSNKLTVDLKNEITTNNESAVKGYMIFLNNKVVDVVNTLPYSITGLTHSTSYSGIYIYAVDENGNTKKSKNTLDNESTTSDPVELVPDDYVASSIWAFDNIYYPSKAFDGSESGLDYWHSEDTTKPQYCGAKYNDKVYVSYFYLSCRQYQSKDIILQGSNDGENWVDIQEFTCTAMSDTYYVTNKYTEEYNYYCIKTVTGDSYVAYYEIIFYGY